MNFVNVRELHIDTARVLSKVRKGKKVIVTKRGKPQVIISPIFEDDLKKMTILNEPLLASESSLKKDWMRAEEDSAWKDL